MDLTTALADVPVIAILRAPDARRFPEVADTLRRAGIRVVEFTMTSAGALEALREYAVSGVGDVLLGAGGVLDAVGARQAVEAGARYLISPAVCADVIAEGRRLGVPVLPGALTPTEILTAWRAGAAAVKVFPAAEAGGPAYIRAVRAPLPDVPLVPTGGVDAEQVPAYLRAGAVAVGMGGPLVGDACAGGSLDALYERAAALVGRVAGTVTGARNGA